MRKIVLFSAIFVLFVQFISGALSVGLNDDVHFDYPNLVANDFHIEGTVHSKIGTPYVAKVIIFGNGGTWVCTGYTIKQIAQDQYWFTIDFKTDGYIKFCQWIHFGIMFTTEAYNIIVDLKGYWTLDGKRITDQKGDVPITGFNVDDISMIRSNGQTIRISNNSGVPVILHSFEIAISKTKIPLEDLFIDQLGRPGEKSQKYPDLKWISIPVEAANLLKDSALFDIYLEKQNIKLESGTFLIMRGQQLMANAPAPLESVKTINGNPDWGYFWEEHEAP